jgi:membrane-associated protease RseP (regulator of RpoE activity)
VISSSVAVHDDTPLSVRVAAIEARLGDLTDEVQTLASGMAALRAAYSAQTSASDTLATTESIRALRGAPVQSETEDLVERLVAGGFSRARAEWIKQRLDEVTMAAIEARYEVERSGADLSTIQLASPGPVLRQELGDTEYEQYLRAVGREPEVNVMEVLANSPAAFSGLRAGDQIISYGGTRVFDFTEVTPLTAQGTAGEAVIVDIIRDGQPMQIVVPRGPLGVRLGGTPIPITFAQPQ